MLIRARALARSNAGVTLIETMITVALVGILVVLAMPAIGSWLMNSRIRTATESIQNGLLMARTEAVRCNVPVQFVLGANSDSSWRIEFAYPNLPTPCSTSLPGWPVVQSRAAAEGSNNVIVVPTPGPAATVTFDGLGRRMTNNADGTAVLTRICVDLPPTVLAAADTRDLEVNVEVGGGVRMCDPKVVNTSDTRICPDRANSACTGR